MNIPILSQLEKLIVEHGSAVVQEKHIALLREALGHLEKQIADLQRTNTDLAARLAETERQLARHTTPSEFLEWKGVLIKRLPGGGYRDTPFCPTCKIPLSVTPTKRLVCNRVDCGYMPHLTIVAFREHLSTLQ
jgi:hypothetical protein